MRIERASIAGVYLVTPDTAGPAFERVLSVVAQALDAGVRVVQYRNKAAAGHEREQQARALVECVARAGALAIVNDDVALAAAVGAHGVHLGRDDGAAFDARARLPEALLGVSCYNDLARAERAVADGADALAFGSVFPSLTKPSAVHAPLELLGIARARWPSRRIVAIGGIGRGNIGDVAAAGAHAAALISAVFEADDPAGAAGQLVQQFQEGQRRYESQRAAV